MTGARFGASGLPDRWVDELRTAAGDPLAEDLRGLAVELVAGEFDSAV